MSNTRTTRFTLGTFLGAALVAAGLSLAVPSNAWADIECDETENFICCDTDDGLECVPKPDPS